MLLVKQVGVPMVLMDEPLKGLDPELYLTVRDYIKEALSGTTALLVTHNPEEAAWFGDDSITL